MGRESDRSPTEPNQPPAWTRDAFIWAMLASTLLSGVQYLWRAGALLRSDSYVP
jgi:hypothetical protein